MRSPDSPAGSPPSCLPCRSPNFARLCRLFWVPRILTAEKLGRVVAGPRTGTSFTYLCLDAVKSELEPRAQFWGDIRGPREPTAQPLALLWAAATEVLGLAVPHSPPRNSFLAHGHTHAHTHMHGALLLFGSAFLPGSIDLGAAD